jgi:putative hydrolase
MTSGFGFTGGNPDDERNPLAGLGEMLQSLGRMLTQPAGTHTLTAAALRQASSASMPSHRIVESRMTSAVDAAGELAQLWLDAEVALPPCDITVKAWSPQEWLEATASGWVDAARPLIEAAARVNTEMFTQGGDEPANTELMPGLPQMPEQMLALLQRMAAGMAEQQLAQAVAEVAARTMMLHEVPANLAPGVAAVLPHVVEDEATALELPKDQSLLWVVIRESALARLFAAHTWIGKSLLDAIAAYADSLTLDGDALRGAISDINPMDPSSLQEVMGSGILEAKPTASGARAQARIATLWVLLESWADCVVARAAAHRIPTLASLTEAHQRRRAALTPTHSLLGSLLDIETPAKQLRTAQGLWDFITTKYGTQTRDHLWSHPDLLPNGDDLVDPTDFLAALNGDSQIPDAPTGDA